MDLAIIIVSYNTRVLLSACLDSVLQGLAESRLSGDVWVVDNASSDGSAEMVRDRYPQLNLIAHDQNVGFAAANNLALAEMRTADRKGPRHVLFLNPDTRVLGDALGELVRFLDATRTAGAAGARLVHGDGSFQHSAFAFPGLKQIALDFFPIHHRLQESWVNGRYPRRLYDSGQPFQVDHPLGAALMVRSNVLEQTGGFDENYFMYCEEIDICRRIRATGWDIYCVPGAGIVHLVGQSTRQFRYEMYVALWRSRFLMFGKYESEHFVWSARHIVRMGLWSKRRQANASFANGEIDAIDLDKRMTAYREVALL